MDLFCILRTFVMHLWVSIHFWIIGNFLYSSQCFSLSHTELSCQFFCLISIIPIYINVPFSIHIDCKKICEKFLVFISILDVYLGPIYQGVFFYLFHPSYKWPLQVTNIETSYQVSGSHPFDLWNELMVNISPRMACSKTRLAIFYYPHTM